MALAPKKNPGEPSWRYRRITIFATIGFCMWLLAYMVDAEDSEINQTIASGALWLMGAIIFAYCGFATVQDMMAMWTTRSARPYADPPVEPTPEAPDTVVVVEPKQENG